MYDKYYRRKVTHMDEKTISTLPKDMIKVLDHLPDKHRRAAENISKIGNSNDVYQVKFSAGDRLDLTSKNRDFEILGVEYAGLFIRLDIRLTEGA